VPAFPGFPSAKEIYECGVIAAVSLLVESVVFDGPVNGSYDRPCGQQAQFQEVFQRARVRGNGIVFGHAEGIDHVRGSLTGLRWHRPFTVSAVPAARLEVAAPATASNAAGGALAGEAAAHLGNPNRQAEPLCVGSGLRV